MSTWSQQKRFKRFTQGVLTVAVFACMASLCEACPTCKEGINDGPNHVNMIRGYFWSIMFMMSMPFMIFGGLSIYFYSMIRKGRAAATGEPITRNSLGSVVQPPAQ